MNSTLYVGNLNYSVTPDGLERMFAPYGQVRSAKIVMSRELGRSRGFGFVEMGSVKEAQAATAGLNGKIMDGRSLTVNEATPQVRPDRGGRTGQPVRQRAGIGLYGQGRKHFD